MNESRITPENGRSIPTRVQEFFEAIGPQTEPDEIQTAFRAALAGVATGAREALRDSIVSKARANPSTLWIADVVSSRVPGPVSERSAEVIQAALEVVQRARALQRALHDPKIRSGTVVFFSCAGESMEEDALADWIRGAPPSPEPLSMEIHEYKKTGLGTRLLGWVVQPMEVDGVPVRSNRWLRVKITLPEELPQQWAARVATS